MQRGYVTGFDRSTGLAQVHVLGMDADVPAMVLTDDVCPRSIVWADQANEGQWVVIGMEGRRRLVMHEDFHVAYRGAAVGVYTPAVCDLEWALVEGTPGTGGLGIYTPTSGQTDRAGFAGFGSGGAAGQYVSVLKLFNLTDNVGFPAGDEAYWMAISMVASTPITTSIVQAGFSTLNAGGFAGLVAADRRVILRHDSALSANWQLVTTVGVTETVTTTTRAVVADEAIHVDLVVQPGQWAAAYINGSLVAANTTNIPEAGAAGQPAFGVYPRAAAARGIALDRFDVSIINTLQSPV